MVLILKSIGRVHSPFKNKQDVDTKKFASSTGFDQVEGELEIDDEFSEGLTDIEVLFSCYCYFWFSQI